jgi:hypothetical protein
MEVSMPNSVHQVRLAATALLWFTGELNTTLPLVIFIGNPLDHCCRSGESIILHEHPHPGRLTGTIGEVHRDESLNQRRSRCRPGTTQTGYAINAIALEKRHESLTAAERVLP